MLTTLCLVISLAIIGLSFFQCLFAWMYATVLFRSHYRRPTGYTPKAAVVLAVRGSDPFLVANMQALLDQDYPDFKLLVIVDSDQDAAWPDVRALQALAPERVEARVLQQHLRTCSLKCSSLAEAVEQLDPSYEVIAFLDGDAPPHRTWLRELVEPLADAAIGVTTGNRWYTPDQISWGAMVRYFWNAGAIVQVWLNGIIWAGSMALRRNVIDEIDLVSSWRRSLSVDGTVVRQLKAAGRRAQFIPSVIMPNREDITIKSFTPWSERQLVAARSSGSGWAVVLFHAFAIATCVFAPVLMLLLAVMLKNGELAKWGLLALAAYWGGAVLSTTAIESGMQSVLRRNQVKANWMNFRAIAYYLPSLVLSHFVYFKALAGATVRKQVSWRGVEYRIASVNDVQMVEYRPYLGKNAQPQLESII